MRSSDVVDRLVSRSVGQENVMAGRRRWLLLVPLLAVAAVAPTPFGGWLQSFVFGTGVRWENAYVALDTAEANLPRNARERERQLVANLLGDSSTPRGLKPGPRVHPAGTLARLRYETFDEAGALLDSWEVRAVMPSIGNGTGPFWREPCGRACRETIDRSKGFRLRRSGEPGIAEEWVLRMPLGKAIELGPQPLRTQDILDARLRTVPLGSVRVDGRSLPRPNRIRVTLVDACAAQVRVGTTMNFEFEPNVSVPIPRGLVKSRWVELDGCGKLSPLPPPPEEPRVQIARAAAVKEAPDLRAITAHRDGANGRAELRVDEAWVSTHGEPVEFHVDRLCRYDPQTGEWQVQPLPDPRRTLRIEPLALAEAAAGARVAFGLPPGPGLFWLRWSESAVRERDARAVRRRNATVVSGPVMCNDISMGTPPEGTVAACVPFASSAEARFVPVPEMACR
jgi:hypothetical protein